MRQRLNPEISPCDPHKMTSPVVITRSYVSDDENDAERAGCPQCEQLGWVGAYCTRCEDQGMTYSVPIQRGAVEEPNRGWRARMTMRFRRLTRIERADNEMPELGQVCLILIGVEGRDLGQQAVVTARTKVRVHVAYREQNGRRGTKLKHPSSLILLENGLEMTQDEQGFVWVRREAGDSVGV